MAPPPDLPASGSLQARLAALDRASSSSSSSREYTGGSLKDKIARYDVQGAPLIPKSAFGTGLGVEGGREAQRGLVGNRIPSAGRGGFGVTPGSSTSRSSSQARSISNSSSHALPSSSTTGNNSGPFSTGRQSPALRSSMESSSNNSNERSTGELSPITSPSPSPSSPAPNTTNALPPSFLAATLPGASRGDGDDDTISRSPSVLVNPPGSTTSLSSLTSNVSVASSYQIEAQQPPYTEVQAAEDDGEATEDEEDRGIRSSSPVGSLFVEPGSKAPSTVGDDDDEQEPRDMNDAPLTPRAEHFRELSLADSSIEPADTTLQDLDEDVKTPPANEEPPFSLVGLQLDPEEEPDVEDAEMVPVLEEKERELFEEQLEELAGSPQVEIGGEAAVEAKVETWAEEVAEAVETEEKVEKVEQPEPVVVEAEEVLKTKSTPKAVHQLDEGEPTPPALPSSLPDLDPSTTLPPPSTDLEHSPEVVHEVFEVPQAPLEGEVNSIAPTDEVVSPPSPIQESAIPIAVAAAFEQEKWDRGVSEDEEKPSHPASDFEPVKDAVVEQEEPKEEEDASKVDPEDLGSPISLDGEPCTETSAPLPPPITSNIPEDFESDDDELSSPIPGSFPGSPTHSSFARSPSRSSSLARASFTLEELEIDADTEAPSQEVDLPPSSSSTLDVEPNEASPQPSPALDMSFISSFPLVPTSSSTATTPLPSSDPTEERPSTPPPLPTSSSIPFPHSKTPEQSEMKRSASVRSTKPTKSPLELDSDDEDVAAAGDGKVTFISRERYS
ncbi:hypothetical protein BDY24DRAFT_379301 [Mrakia frigida]|uniref:uncharacterized protein n=1 Tax=Mrakia frigida TaxID=29902 RepID=UPI003FCBF355